MADTNLKVTKVYMYNRKQVGFIISLSIGIVSSYSKIMLKSRDNFISLIDKIKCANATVSKSGVVRVSFDVPLEDIDAIKPKNDSVESLKAQLAEKNKVIEGLNKQLTEVTDRYLALRGEYHNLRVTARNKGWF